MKEIYTYNEMQELIDSGEAKIIKKNERENSKGHRRCSVTYNENIYLLCNDCDNFLLLKHFSDRKNKKLLHGKACSCKECNCKIMKYNYRNNFIVHLRHRYKSLEKQSGKYSVPIMSFDEFISFAKTIKEPIFGITLEEAFNKNIESDFEVEHKIPISQNGSTLLENLTLSYKPFNRIKGTNTVDETFKLIELLLNNKDKILEAYNN